MTGQNTPAALSDEMLVVLDEARAIALARGEIYIASEDLLSAMAQTGVSTAGMLQRRGVTPAAIAALAEEGVVSRGATTHDWVAAARKGALAPVFPRTRLLHELTTLLAHANGRNVLLIGPNGVGRRSLVQGLAFAVVEGRGPRGIDKIIEVSEAAWLDNPALAMQVGLRQAARHRQAGGARDAGPRPDPGGAGAGGARPAALGRGRHPAAGAARGCRPRAQQLLGVLT